MPFSRYEYLTRLYRDKILLAIGWIGSAGNGIYLKLIAEPLRVLYEAFGARLRLMGGGGKLALPSVPIDHVPWCEYTEAAKLAHCHVEGMPLSDDPWERGSGYKLTQCMTAERSAVASPVGAAPSIIVPEHTGLLTNNTEEWIASLSSFAKWKLARCFRMAARQRAEARYSLQVDASKLVALFKQALLTNASSKEPLLNTRAA